MSNCEVNQLAVLVRPPHAVSSPSCGGHSVQAAPLPLPPFTSHAIYDVRKTIEVQS